MQTLSAFLFEHFRFGAFRIFRDAGGQPVMIPSGPDREGYLLVDPASKRFAQVRFAKADDSASRQRLNLVWKSFAKVKDSVLCPRIHGFGVFESASFCVTSLPNGEPVRQFIDRNGVVPVETGVLLILEFVRSLLHHKPAFHKRYAIHPASVWVCRSKDHPKIALGEFLEMSHDHPELHNIHLCADLLKFLTGSPSANVAYQKLLQSLEESVRTLEDMEKALAIFAQDNPSGNYWMGYNEPVAIHEKVAFPVIREDEWESRARLLLESARRKLWPALMGSSMAVIFFMIYCIISLKTPSRVPAKPAPIPVVYATAPVVRPLQVVPVVPVATEVPVITRVIHAPAASPALDSPARVTPTAVMVPAKPANSLLRRLLANTGELFAEWLRKPISEWLIFDEPPKDIDPTQFTEEDSRKLTLLQLKKASAEARLGNRLFDAAKLELETLRIEPHSIEARYRLHEDLAKIKEQVFQITLDEVQKSILREAESQNSLAREILQIAHRPSNG